MAVAPHFGAPIRNRFGMRGLRTACAPRLFADELVRHRQHPLSWIRARPALPAASRAILPSIRYDSVKLMALLADTGQEA
jgi:hypothetical protein